MVKCSRSEIRRLKIALLRWKKIPEKQRERIKMVLLRENGLTQPAIAEAVAPEDWLEFVRRSPVVF